MVSGEWKVRPPFTTRRSLSAGCASGDQRPAKGTIDPRSPFATRHSRNSDLLHLAVFEFDRGRPAEDRDRHLEAGAALVNLLDDAVEGREGAVGHPDLLADLEMDRGLRPVDAL